MARQVNPRAVSSLLARPSIRSLRDGSTRRKIGRYVRRPFGLFDELFRMQASIHAAKTALICGDDQLTYEQLDDVADRLAGKMQQAGVEKGQTVAVCAANSATFIAIMIATLRAGAVISPLSPHSTPAQLRAMLDDSNAVLLFVDEVGAAATAATENRGELKIVRFTPEATLAFADAWAGQRPTPPVPVEIGPDDRFDIIYSSGTTGTPKGVVHPHATRWPELHLKDPPGYGPDATAIISTPLYSNTTIGGLLPALAGGGSVVVMSRFDARRFLELSERHRVTVATLVPVQYRRILDVPDFDRFDLSSYQIKFATSAPFSAEIKAEVLRRWPGGLVEWYGMTEGGGGCMLVAHHRPDKLHTVGQAIPGHELRVIDDSGQALPPGQPGEIVGRSRVMMTGYHNQPGKTAEAEWFSPEGLRYIRTGDIGTMDDEGFLTLIGRKKDVIISGGINIYPIDLETALDELPEVAESAVIGVPSERWGETPVAFVTLVDGARVGADDLLAAANAKLGKMQRLADLRIVDELPRNPIGKLLKRELAERYAEQPAA